MYHFNTYLVVTQNKAHIKTFYRFNINILKHIKTPFKFGLNTVLEHITQLL